MAKRGIAHIPRHEATAALVAFAVGVVLLALKFVAYFITGSSAVFSDALESIVNVLASTFALYSIFLAHQPPDDEHPYGHGKVEFLSAGFEGGMIVLAALTIVAQAVSAWMRGERVEDALSGLAIMAVAMILNGGVGLYLIQVGKRAGALTLEADGKHLLSDAITSVAVIAALAVVQVTGWALVDNLVAIGVAVYIALMGVGLLRRSASGLMDRQEAEDTRLIEEILARHTGPDAAEPQICSAHKVRHRHTGRYHWVDFHMVVPAGWSIARGHEAASVIEKEMEDALGEADATAHVEPCVRAECTRCHPPQQTQT